MSYQNFPRNQMGNDPLLRGNKPVATIDTFIDTSMQGTQQVLQTVNSIR